MSETPDEAEPEPDPRAELQRMAPCKLLGREQLKRLGWPTAEPERGPGAGRTRRCEWVEYSDLISLLVNTHNGIAPFDRDPTLKDAARLRINGRDARQAKRVVGPGTCWVALAVSRRAMVSITGFVQELVRESADGAEFAPGNPADACRLARRAAELVEPRLP